MEVHLKLLLQGGHVWDFCCSDDDPVVFGLVSALPGADVAGNLPPDGLIQIETRTGERLFLTRSSLVSLEVARIDNPLKFLGTKRLSKPSDDIPAGYLIPSPFVLTHDALPGDVHAALVAHAINQNVGTVLSQTKLRELALGPVEKAVAERLRSHIAEGGAILGLAEPVEVELNLRLLAVGDTQALALDKSPVDVAYLVYHFHKQPKKFTGGGIRVFDSQAGNATSPTRFRDVEIGDNDLLIFPAHLVSAGLPVRCPEGAFEDSLFVIHGVLRRREAHD